MAFGIPDSSTAPPPVEWNQGDNKNQGPQKSNPTGGGPAAPTSVDTPTLDAFANYMSELIPSLNRLVPDLNLVDVQPGAFYHADQIRTVINGLNGDTGLKARFQQVIADLVQGLTDIQTAVTEMSNKYKSTEDVNNMSVNDLQTEFQAVQSDFSTLMSDAAGSPSKSGG
jgi:hypothetical protein